MAGIDNYTKLLLHMDDVDLTDSSLAPHTVTKEGSIARSATQSKFGGYSAYFDGDGGHLSIPDSDDWYFASEDFTIDFWFRRSDATIQRFLSGYASNLNRWYLGLHSDQELALAVLGGGVNIYPGMSWSNICSDINTWYHLALVRDGNDFELFENGISKGTITDSSPFNDYASPLYVGIDKYNSSVSFKSKGYIDELRISKGIARWTTNFTPPTAAYSPYEVGGILSHDSKIIVLDESSGAVEYNGLVSAGAYKGAYNVPVGDNSEKLIAAFRTSNGEALGYGKVIPVEE